MNETLFFLQIKKFINYTSWANLWQPLNCADFIPVTICLGLYSNFKCSQCARFEKHK